MRDGRPLPVALIIGRIVAAVIAARHAREMEKVQPVPAGRTLNTETTLSRAALHAPSSHGATT